MLRNSGLEVPGDRVESRENGEIDREQSNKAARI